LADFRNFEQVPKLGYLLGSAVLVLIFQFYILNVKSLAQVHIYILNCLEVLFEWFWHWTCLQWRAYL